MQFDGSFEKLHEFCTIFKEALLTACRPWSPSGGLRPEDPRGTIPSGQQVFRALMDASRRILPLLGSDADKRFGDTMKANRKTLWANDTRAQVGIGTMIVFIATILVAATAAAVLIDTSGKLQERSSQTGNEATDQVSSNLIVKGIYGDRTLTTGSLLRMNITLGLAPGAESVDLAQAKILYSNGNTRAELDNTATHNGNDNFVAVQLRDPKNTFATATPVMSPGGLVNLEINLEDLNAGAGLTLAERADITILIIPEVGAPVHADFTAPASYGSDKVIELR